MKKLLTVFGVVLVLSFVHAIESTAEQQTWKIGHVRQEGSAIDLDIREFTDTIQRGTDGAISFDIYPANKLGDYSVVQERVSFGEVEMYVGPFGTAVDKRLMLAFTPFLVENWDQARRLYSPDSPLIAHIEKILEAQNLKLVGGWPVYFGGIALTQRPAAPGDPDVFKKMIIRVPPIRSFEMTARALGYTPYPITWMYAKMGLRTGMVKGLIGGGAEGYKGLAGMIRYYVPLRDHFEYWFVYMNLDTWNNLSARRQDLIRSAAADMETRRYQVAEDQEQASLAELQELGVEVYPLSTEEFEKMRAKIQEVVWPELRKDIGQPFDDIVTFVQNQD